MVIRNRGVGKSAPHFYYTDFCNELNPKNMKFAGTKRNRYTKEKVRQMHFDRKLAKPKVTGVPDQFYLRSLGELQAAGHLRITGFTGIRTDVEESPQEGNPYHKHTTSINIERWRLPELGDAPHMIGYLESASNADKETYRIKGWFNEDGTIRIELVK